MECICILSTIGNAVGKSRLCNTIFTKLYYLVKTEWKLTISVLEISVTNSRQTNPSDENKFSDLQKSEEVLCIAVSPNDHLLAASTQNKRLIIWELATLAVQREVSLIKRPMAMEFLPDSTKIIVADKSGDVYSYSVDGNINEEKPYTSYEKSINEEPGPEPLLGHLSMLLDLAVTYDGKYIITCDRDEKIRVSCYPNSYNIHTFCLGHTDFVSQVCLLRSRSDRLLSASGDGKIKMWDHLKGECCQTLDVRLQVESLFQECFDFEDNEAIRTKLDSSFISILRVFHLTHEKNIVAVSLYGLPVLLFYELHVSDNSFRVLHFLKLPANVVDFIFLKSGEIFVYVETSVASPGCKRNPFTLFKFHEDLNGLQELRDHPLLQFGLKYCEELKVKKETLLDAFSLFKHNKFNNVDDYQKKKQERLNSLAPPVKRKASEL